MEDFRKLFYEEAGELISNLEENLMLLEENLSNTEVVNEIFRIMHSLKGSGAMFGFNHLSSFTHDLESLYDKVRSGELVLTNEIVDYTLEATNYINELLNAKDDDDIIERSKIYLQKIESFYHKTDQNIKKVQLIEQKEPEIKSDNKNNIYFINFEPNPNILNDGTNPLYLIDELSDLGTTIIKTTYKDLPPITDIDFDICYFKWNIILSSDQELNTIKEVFIFVEDDSVIDIELISNMDLFSIPEVEDKIKELFLSNIQDISGIKKLLKLYENDFINLNKPPNKLIVGDEETNLNIIETIKNPIDIVSEKPSNVDTLNTQNTIELSKIDTVKVSSDKLDTLINLVSELVTAQARLNNFALEHKSNEINALSEDFQHLSRQFRDVAFEIRLIPIQTLVVKFKRLVRDLSKSLGKNIDFITEGTDAEVDKNINAKISDPLMHIIRNSIDHGIESPDTRNKKNKSPKGKIILKAEYSGAYILISISDDGAGIDPEIILKKALEKKLITDTKDYSLEEIYKFLLMPGFTTSEKLTDVSGRGVGMDVVKRKINDLHGEVIIQSEKDQGTTIVVKLPLTLSIIDGLLVSVKGNKYIIPLVAINQIILVQKKDLDNSYKHIITIEGQQFTFINLIDKFESNISDSSPMHLILVNYYDKQVGLIVNDLIGEYQAVLKPIDKMLKENEIFSGATILGDGKVALVIDSNKLINHFNI